MKRFFPYFIRQHVRQDKTLRVSCLIGENASKSSILLFFEKEKKIYILYESAP